jgi:hypothetical protein
MSVSASSGGTRPRSSSGPSRRPSVPANKPLNERTPPTAAEGSSADDPHPFDGRCLAAPGPLTGRSWTTGPPTGTAFAHVTAAITAA